MPRLLDTFTNAANITIVQILGVLGVFFLFGFFLSVIQRQTQSIYRDSLGWKGILWTAWIGTPIHELGHAFFAKLFRHQISSWSLFSPNKRTGGLGYVDHRYNPHSLYQRIGNFFIGAAPMIWGSIIMVTLLYILLPGGRAIFLPLPQVLDSSWSIFSVIGRTLQALFSPDRLSSWRFWLFLYLSFCVASHLAPSPEDQDSMWLGFLWLIGLLFIINLITLWFGVDITEYILYSRHYLGIFIAIFLYALLISLAHLVLTYIILRPFVRR